MKAIAISNPLNAMINDKGNNPIKKNKTPLAMIWYVKPLKIANSRWPAATFAVSLKPKETARAVYEINSINTNSGSNAKGVPAGTNNEKNSKPCFWNPRIVVPITMLKLKENVKMIWEVEAKL